MKLSVFLVLLPLGMILGKYDHSVARQNEGVSEEYAVMPESKKVPERVDAQFEGVYNPLVITYQFDTLRTQMENTTVSFCGDTIIINGKAKGLFSRRRVATKNMFRQNTPYQQAVYKYFGARNINLRDSVDKLLIENLSEDPNDDSFFMFTRPGIIYRKPYLLVPFHGNYMISYIVEIEPTEYNRLLP